MIGIERYKVSPQVWLGNVSRKIIVTLEGQYRKRSIFSAEYKLHDGIQLAIPWSEKLSLIKLHFKYIDERLKCDLGTSQWRIPSTNEFYTDGTPNRVILDILPNGGSERIGKILGNISIQILYAKEQCENPTHRPLPLQNEPTVVQKTNNAIFNTVIPGFRFRKLSKAVNWHRLRGINIDR